LKLLFKKTAIILLKSLKGLKKVESFRGTGGLFFLPGIYLLYRKVYLWGFLIIVGRVLTMKLPLSGIFWGIIVGMFANYLIYKRYKALLKGAENRGLNEEETIEFLKREGGVSKFFAIWAIIAVGYNLFGLIYILTNG